MEKNKVVIFGNRSTAEFLMEMLHRDSQYRVAAFAVDSVFIQEDAFLGLPLVPFDKVAEIYPPHDYRMMIGIGYVKMNQLKADRFNQAKEMGYEMISYVSPRSSVWSGFKVNENVRIGDFCSIQPGVEIGSNVQIGTGCIIGHNTFIKEHCYLSMGVNIAGHVTVEPFSFIGAHATIRNKVTIARSSLIGAGAVILEDTVENGVYKTHPAELLPILSNQIHLE